MSNARLPLLPAPACCAGVGPAPRPPGVDALARVFRALADETRLRILALLGAGEVCVCHLHASLRLPQPTVSRHLAYLRRTGLVAARRDGVWMHYRLNPALDAVSRGAVDAALHALTHARAIEEDARRLKAELSA
ncbi:MAG: metalloregulator ArsR/SmtB family transcription factor [Acidobacteriota bacterium]